MVTVVLVVIAFISVLYASEIARAMIADFERSYEWRSVDPDAPTREDWNRRCR